MTNKTTKKMTAWSEIHQTPLIAWMKKKNGEKVLRQQMRKLTFKDNMLESEVYFWQDVPEYEESEVEESDNRYR